MRITSPEHYLDTDSAQLPIYVDFGERVSGRLVAHRLMLLLLTRVVVWGALEKERVTEGSRPLMR